MNRPSPIPNSTHSTLDRIAVTGAGGLLGNALCQILGSRAIPIRSADVDFRHPTAVHQHFVALAPHAVINCAAYTAVDQAESDRETCLQVNGAAVELLARATSELQVPLIQISTDYLFCRTELRRPLRESDPLAPAGAYAESKLVGEQAAAKNAQHTIVRTCGLYGVPPQPTSRNFVLTMLRLGKERPSLRIVDDQICCPTYAPELAAAILHLLDSQTYGTFHVVNSDGLTWRQFAEEIFQAARYTTDVIPISSEEYAAPATRPPYSVLDTSRYLALQGPRLSTCRDAVRQFVAEYLANSQHAN